MGERMGRNEGVEVQETGVQPVGSSLSRIPLIGNKWTRAALLAVVPFIASACGDAGNIDESAYETVLKNLEITPEEAEEMGLTELVEGYLSGVSLAGMSLDGLPEDVDPANLASPRIGLGGLSYIDDGDRLYNGIEDVEIDMTDPEGVSSLFGTTIVGYGGIEGLNVVVGGLNLYVNTVDNPTVGIVALPHPSGVSGWADISAPFERDGAMYFYLGDASGVLYESSLDSLLSVHETGEGSVEAVDLEVGFDVQPSQMGTMDNARLLFARDVRTGRFNLYRFNESGDIERATDMLAALGISRSYFAETIEDTRSPNSICVITTADFPGSEEFGIPPGVQLVEITVQEGEIVVVVEPDVGIDTGGDADAGYDGGADADSGADGGDATPDATLDGGGDTDSGGPDGSDAEDGGDTDTDTETGTGDVVDEDVDQLPPVPVLSADPNFVPDEVEQGQKTDIVITVSCENCPPDVEFAYVTYQIKQRPGNQLKIDSGDNGDYVDLGQEARISVDTRDFEVGTYDVVVDYEFVWLAEDSGREEDQIVRGSSEAMFSVVDRPVEADPDAGPRPDVVEADAGRSDVGGGADVGGYDGGADTSEADGSSEGETPNNPGNGGGCNTTGGAGAPLEVALAIGGLALAATRKREEDDEEDAES